MMVSAMKGGREEVRWGEVLGWGDIILNIVDREVSLVRWY